MPAPLRASLFGKLPTTLDYVRVNHASSAAIAYDEWLERCQHELVRSNSSWPGAGFRFVFTPAGDSVLVGVVVPSRDRAGRKFPATIYVTLSRRQLNRMALIPQGWASFFSAAEAVLGEGSALKGEQLAARVAEIPVPSEDDLDAQGPSRQAMLRSRSLTDFALTPFQGSSQESVRAALQRFVRGLEPAASPEHSPVLDCPVVSEADVVAWLSLAERKLSTVTRVPWCFWSLHADQERMLLGQGAVPPALPSWIRSGKPKSERLWSLRPVLPAGRPAPSDSPQAQDDLEAVGSDSEPELGGEESAIEQAGESAREQDDDRKTISSPPAFTRASEGPLQPNHPEQSLEQLFSELLGQVAAPNLA